MPTIEIKEIIPASADKVFELLHDYKRRLEWDTLLSEAYLEPEFAKAEKDAVSVCRGKAILGGFAVRTRYVSFEEGKVAAVKMLNSPPFFDTFAASIRHLPLDGERSQITYKVNFTARPRWLSGVLEPVMKAVFTWETRKRLQALKAYFQKENEADKKSA
jgi:ribosome-associated toxin RatA of RatAB toxin-antitoxin module